MFKEIVGYRFSATGVYGYEFTDGEEIILKVSGIVAPSYPVSIQGEGIRWISSHDSDITIYPGVKRYLNDKETGSVAVKIEYCESGKYVLNDCVTAYRDREEYSFRIDDELIAKISRCSRDAYSVPDLFDNYYDWEPYFEVSIYRNTDRKTLAMICSFPMLEFAL